MAKFDITTLEIPAPVAKPVYAGVGATDLVVEYVRETVADVTKKFTVVQKDVTTRVADVQKNVKGFDFEPKALRSQATTVVNSRVDTLSKEAKARRSAVEARVADLQSDAKSQADKVSKLVDENVATVTDTYADLAKRGETLVARIRKQEATKATVTSAKTTTAKAKATKTQATKATKSTTKTAKSAAKRTSTAAKKSSAPARSSAKATTTAAKKTATKATKAASDAAAKVGD